MSEVGTLNKPTDAEQEAQRAAERKANIQMLGLNPDASDETISSALTNHTWRIQRATHLGLPEEATWSEISATIRRNAGIM